MSIVSIIVGMVGLVTTSMIGVSSYGFIEKEARKLLSL